MHTNKKKRNQKMLRPRLGSDTQRTRGTGFQLWGGSAGKRDNRRTATERKERGNESWGELIPTVVAACVVFVISGLATEVDRSSGGQDYGGLSLSLTAMLFVLLVAMIVECGRQ